MPEPLLRFSSVGKSFGATRALDQVSFDVLPGEVHVLAGENGAGKSTLIKILAGVHPDFEGEMTLAGETLRPASPQEARLRGISVIHQELSLVDTLSVCDNIHLGRESAGLGGLWLDRRGQRARSVELCRQLNLGLSAGDLSRAVEEYPLSVKNRIEIAKALAFEARVIVMDEPTSALDRPDVDTLFELVAALRARGCAVIYITHKMEEITRIADRITVLRDGKWVGTAPASECPKAQVIRWMVGRELSEQFPERSPRRAGAGTAPALEVRGLCIPDRDRSRRDAVRDLTLSVAPGEILGVAGLQGSGTSELFQGLFGAHVTPTAGTVRIGGETFSPKNPRDSIARGLAYLTADRKGTGLVLGMGVEANMSLASLPRVSPLGLMRRGIERSRAREWAKALGLRFSSFEQPVGTLSGGNQQKVVLAKWLGAEPRVLLLEDPTRGVDVGAKREIYALMRAWTGEGMAILLISSELPELLGLSDRILVLHRGSLSGEFTREEATQERVLAAAMGAS